MWERFGERTVGPGTTNGPPSLQPRYLRTPDGERHTRSQHRSRRTLISRNGTGSPRMSDPDQKPDAPIDGATMGSQNLRERLVIADAGVRGVGEVYAAPARAVIGIVGGCGRVGRPVPPRWTRPIRPSPRLPRSSSTPTRSNRRGSDRRRSSPERRTGPSRTAA